MIGDSEAGSGPGPRLHERPHEDVQATFCATIVDEWIELGVRHAVIAPGSRSTPIAVALATRPELKVHVVHDERAAAFVALGVGLSGDPAILACTSGTAAANFLPAVVEAGLSEVPMIVATADRPPELQGVGAPQTIDQNELYGSHVRWFHDVGVPDAAGVDRWRALAALAHRHAGAGPVHLNLPFREPLLGVARRLPPREPLGDVLPPAETRAAPPSPFEADVSVRCCAEARGVILAGGRSGVDPIDVLRLGELTGWPVIADPMSFVRPCGDTILHAESLLRADVFATSHQPDVVVRIGRPASSRTLSEWAAGAVIDGATMVQVGGPGVIDPTHDVDAVCTMSALIDAALDIGADTADDRRRWATSWADADRLAAGAIARELDVDPLTEPAIARVVAEHLPAGADLTVASSMPVRDLEWFGGVVEAHCNRGANGIDGVVSTALGRSLHGRPGVVLVGDLAFVHDQNALVGIVDRDVDLRIVVVDNDGGGIFSFLPQASRLDEKRFEQLFGTPLGVDVTTLASAHRVRTSSVTTRARLIEELGVPGPSVIRVPSERTQNVLDHARLHRAVVEGLTGERGR